MTSYHCPMCDTEMRLVRDVKDFRLGNRTATVETEFFRCEGCGETLYTPAQMDDAQRRMAAEMRRQEGLLTPDEIKSIRVSKALTQSEFEQLLGVGQKTVVRWERGTVFQNRATDTLMRLIDEVPGVLEHLAALRGVRHGIQMTRPRSVVRNILPFVPQGTKPFTVQKRRKEFGDSLQRTRLHPGREAELPLISRENLQ